ncbi:MAG TPA: NfeD family protein [Candidatus Dormibacteraeota bacterium]|nr:NfeD family protein [Candidatus Dormibacteraeota bacterium]
MRALRRAISIVALLFGTAALLAPVAGAGDHVVRLRLFGVIDQVNAAYIEEGLKAAAESGAAAALIEIDSPGGELTSLDRILKAILASSVPVITWVTPEGAQAASAAAFVTLAGDVAAMAPSTSIGAASVVGSGGAELPETIAKKITNSAVAKITELARDHGRNVEWAESAVRDAASVSASEAIAMEPPVVDLMAAEVGELFAAIDLGARADGRPYTFDGAPLPPLAGLTIRDVTMNFGQQFLHVLSDPNVAFILFTIGFYGIISELFHPNFFSGSIGAIAIVLAFIGSNSLPLNIGGLLLILFGIALFVLELNVTSFGLLTIGGIVSIVLGSFALWTGVNPEEEAIRVEVSPWLLVVVVALSLAYVFGVVRVLMQMRRQTTFARPIAALMGAGGVAQTLIAPTGIAFAGGEAWSARSRGPEIPPGTPVRVVDVEGLELIVEPSPEGAQAPSTAEPQRP